MDFNIIGYFNCSFGLSENSRQLYSSLNNSNYDAYAIKTYTNAHKCNSDFSANYLSDNENSNNINIFCINWNEDINVIAKKMYYITINKINTVLWAFETEKFYIYPIFMKSILIKYIQLVHFVKRL